MALARCSYCGERNSDKYSQVTWAWQRADNTRSAWRQRLCPKCFTGLILPLGETIVSDDPLTCPVCGEMTEHDYDAVYATAFIPGFGKQRYEWPLCAAHAVDVRNRATKGAERLEDRPVGGQAQAPNEDEMRDAWAELGVRFRE